MRRQCKHCMGIVGIDIMEDEWIDSDKMCAPCMMSIETGEPPESEKPDDGYTVAEQCGER